MNIRLSKKLAFVLFSLISGLTTLAQSGPGGKGTTDGSSNLVLWLRADAGVEEAAADPAEDTDPVFTWLDQSGYGYHAAVGAGTPFYDASNANFNGMPTITFVEGNTDWLFIEDDGDEAPMLDNTSEISIFYVFNPDNSTDVRAHLSKRDGNGSAQSYVFYENGSQNSRINSNNDAGQSLTGGTTYINATTYQNGDFDHFLNQVSGGGVSGGTASIPNNNSDLNIGEFQSGDGRTFDGNMAEIIVFREYLTNAERIVVETYLASKYGIALGNDFWDEATYSANNNEIAGIGQHTDGTIANSATSGALTISGGDGRVNGEWLFWGHDGGDFATYSSTEIITSTNHQRLAREWVVNETNDLGSVLVSIPASELPATGIAAPTFYLYVDADGNFTNATANVMALNGANYEVTLDLNEGDYLAIAFEPPVPAGITTSLAFWFDAGSGVENTGSPASDGQAVTVWQDLSSNDADGQNGTSPTYSETNGVNFHPVVRFDAASNEFLEFDISGLETSNYAILAVVRRASGTGSQYVLGSENNAVDALLLGYSSNTQIDARNSSTAAVSTAVNGFDNPIEGPVLIGADYNGSTLAIAEFRDGVESLNVTATSTDYAATGYTGNLGRALAGNYLDGDIMEIIAFDGSLSANDLLALESYLGIKYGIDLGQDYQDEQAALLWDLSDNAGYTEDVIAIGRDDSFTLDQRISTSAMDSVVVATSSDFTSLNSALSRPSLTDGQYVFLSNDDDPFTFDQSHNGTPNIRLDRTWRVREVNNPGSVVIGVKSSAVDANVLIVSNDPTFMSGVTELSLASVGDYVYASYDFTDGDYFTFVNDPSEIWYSYISGNWSDPQNWTLDGAISALYVNPLGKVPSAGDSVVVKSGRTITMDGNGVNVTKVEVIGTLDLGSTTGHDLGYLEGNGTLRLSGFGGLDNYPTAIDTAFYEILEGGTVEYYGTGLTLDQTRRYNNLIINLDNSTDLVTMEGDSLYISGDFTIQQGMFQINSSSGTTDLAIEVRGAMQVDATGTFDVGTGNARHELNLYGDFTNFGDVDFTNRASQTTGSEATNGIVDFNLLSGNQNQVITLEGPTNFYRIEVNKGVDKTYVADFQASDPSYFELYGYAGQSHGSVAQLTSNDNAVGLIIGTLKAGTNVDLGPLNTGGNYNVSEGAELWIDGGSAFKNGGTAIVPYGNIRVSAGTLEADINSGITSRANGTLYMEGGEVTIRQFRTSIFGATNQGGIVMTGGILNVTGETNGGINDNYYPVNLTYSGNVFIMSGGTMNVYGANPKGGIFVNSATENILTGGSLNFISSTNNDFIITSRAAFFNVVLSKTSPTGGDFLIGTGQSGPNGTDETVEDLPFEILNDLTLDNSDGYGVTADLQGNNLVIQGSLNIDAGSSIDLTDNTLVFEGAGSSSLNIGLASALVLDSLQINKNNELVTSNITAGPDPAIQVDHYFNITSGNFDPGVFNITLNGDLSIADTLGTATSTGVLSMSGGSAQTIDASDGAIYDLLINNPNGITQDGDLSVIDLLTMTSGVLDIDNNSLTLYQEPVATTSFDATTMITTSGNDSDEGLSMYFDDDETILYPLGTDANAIVRYTPILTTIDASGDDGFVTINPVDLELALLDQSISGDALTYYWKSLNTGFAGTRTASYVMNFVDTADDVPAADAPESDYIPGWTTGVSRVQDPVNNSAGDGMTITSATTSPHTLVDGKYTAATPDKFLGTIRVVYSIRNGEWHDPGTWSSAPDGTPYTMVSELPGPGDIVQLGDNNENHAVAVCDGINDDCSGTNFAAISVAQVSILRQGGGESSILTVDETGSIHDFGIVTNREPGATTVSTEASKFAISGSTIPNGDFGDFNTAPNTIFAYSLLFPATVTSARNITKNGGGTVSRQEVASFVIGNTLDEYPILQFESSGGSGAGSITFPDIDLTINSDMRFFNSGGNENVVVFNAAGTAVTVKGDVVTNNNNAIIRYPATGSASTLRIEGDLDFSNRTNTYIEVENAVGSLEHLLQVQGNIINPSASTFLNLYRDASSSVIDLEFFGEGNSIFNDFTNTPSLNRIIINKGTDSTTYVDILTDIDLNSDNTVAEPIDLQSGKVILNNSDINLTLANGIDFSIPEGTGLEVTQGTITMDGSVVILDGLLKVNGGSVTLTDTDIEYSNTGFAVLEISSGSFEAGNIIRRAITTSTGVLKYRQTGGTVLIASDNAPTYSPSRASFEVANTGSEFTLTGGSFTIQRGVTGDNNVSLLLTPETYDVTGSTVTLGNANTPSYGANYFNLKTSVPLDNLTIFDDGDDNFPPVRLIALPLTVNGTLDIAANAGLIANGFDVTLNGDFSNEGVYTNASATTTFGSATAQSITGAGTFTIYDLVKTGAGETQTNQNLSLTHDLRVEEGTLNIQDYTLSLRNDAYIESTVTNSAASNGIVFNGTSNQDLYGIPNQTVTLGTMTVSNSAGVDIADGNGYNFDLTDRLRLNGGVFNIGGSLVTIKRGGYVEEVSTFNQNNMVQTNSSFTDNGFRQEFYTVAVDTTVFFPVGELKYTPVQFDLNAGTTQGDIRVRPANEMHPTVVDNPEPITEAEIVDADNALQYYWIIIAQDLTNANGTATFIYDHDDIRVTAPYDTTNYISARLLSNGVTWDKFAPTDFWGGTTSFRVPLSNANSDLITGDYTSGVGSSDGINNDIEGALPDELAQYDSNFGGVGNYNSDADWTPIGSTPALSSGVGPVGAQVTISSGDDVSLNLSNVRLYSTHIEAGGILRVPSGSLRNRLGNVTGSGTIVLVDTELLPAGEYSAFTACDGGGLQYSGTTTYSVLSGISQIRRVIFDGSGTRIMPNNALDVCDTLIVQGPTVNFNAGQTYNIGNAVDDLFEIQSGNVTVSNSSIINVDGNWSIGGGTLNGGSNSRLEVSGNVERTAGTLNWNNMPVYLDGSVEQLIDGDFTGANAFDRLRIDNSSVAGVTINTGDVEVDGTLTFVDGLVNTTSTETLTLTSTGNWTGASASSYITGPMTKEDVAVSSTYEFPVGKTARYAPVAVADVVTGGDTWTAEYFTSTNPTYPDTMYDPADPGSGKNAISDVKSSDRWEVTSAGSNSAQVRVTYGPHDAFTDAIDIRVVWWDPIDGRWENMGAVTTGTASAGTSRSEDFISFSTQQFGLADAPEVPLPVELVFFRAVLKDGRVVTSWQTASEINNDYFEVQRSGDGENWEVLGRVNGAGDSDEILDYSFTDSSPYSGISYYRIEQFDYDGASEVFNTVAISNTTFGEALSLTLKPNPTTSGEINFEVSSGDDRTPIVVTMVDLSGKVAFQKTFDAALRIEDKIIPQKEVKAGLYFVTVVQGQNNQLLKLILKE